MAIDGGRPAGRQASLTGTTLLLIALTAAACRPTVQVPAANLVYSAALRTAANTKNPDRLQAAAALIERDREAGQIGTEEYACYERIIAAAEAGRWEEAERSALKFRRDQLR
jgi:hypothetical protein